MNRSRGVHLLGFVLVGLSLVILPRVAARADSGRKHEQQAAQSNPVSQSANQNEAISERTERRGSQLLLRQTQEEADAKTRGCMSSGCHNPIDSATMHAPGTVRLGCTDCHGGDASVMNSAAKDSAQYHDAKNRAHVRARFHDDERSAANPVRSYFGARWLKES